MKDNADALTLQAFQKYWESAQDMTFIKDLDGAYVSASESFLKATVCNSLDELIGKTDFDIFSDSELAKRYVNDDARLLANGVSLEKYIEPYSDKDGLPRYCLTSKYILRDPEGVPTGILGVSRDITREYRAKQSYENELRNLFELPENTLLAVLFDITSWRVIDVRSRDGADNIVSQYVTMDEYIQTTVDAVAEDEALRTYLKGLTKDALEAEYQNGVRNHAFAYLRRMHDGALRWVEDVFHFLVDPVNGNLTLIVLMRDIDASKRRYSELVRAAERDAVTDLLNRSALIRQTKDFLQEAESDQMHALFMIDLDNFKQINDNFGHQQGDRILRDVSVAIKNTFRSADIIGRMGGDEFFVLMKNITSENAVRRKARELLSELQFNSCTDDKELSLTSSVGVTIFRTGERDLDTLYREADTALYRAKREGKNRYCIANCGTEIVSHEEPATAIDHVDTVQLRTLLEYMDGGVVLAEVADDIRITYVSPSLCRAFGRDMKRSTDPSQGIFAYVLKEDRSALKASIFQAAQGGACIDHSYRVAFKDKIEWRRIRTKRIPERGDGLHRVVSVITDVSDIKRSNERLLEMEMRYRTAIEQTKAMLWEVDIPSKTLTLTGPGWSDLGVSERNYPNAPENCPDIILPDSETSSVFRHMFDDIYAARESAAYCFRSSNFRGKEIWLNATYKLIYNEQNKAYCALGVTVPVPNINVEMRRFEQEIHFYDVVKASLNGFIRVNYTQNLLEAAIFPSDARYAAFPGMPFDEFHRIICDAFVDAESVDQFRHQTSPEVLPAIFDEGDNWRFVDYRRINFDGSRCWTSIFIKLMRHPISGDLYAFAYLRDNEICHGWETALGTRFLRNSSLSLYTQETMRAISTHILGNCAQHDTAAVSVIELSGINRMRVEVSAQEANELLFTFGRICLIAVAGNVIIGQFGEDRIALLRAGAGSVAQQKERVSSTIAMLNKLLSQAYPEADVKLVSGFALEEAHAATYDQLLRKATIACTSAAQALGVNAVAYADNGVESPDETDARDLADRYHALELRYQQISNLLHVSENDELTGILGKAAFYRRVREVLDSSPDTVRLLVRLDINRFKVFNDVHGVAAGDMLLRSLAARIRECAQPDMLYARLVSDHFVLLVPDDFKAVMRSTDQLAQWLSEYMPEFRLSCTVGVYRIIDPSIDVSLMCDRALLALLTGKTGFETKLVFYDETLRDRLLEEQQLMDDMHVALAGNQFELYFQPQVNYSDGSLVGAEALVRWNHPKRGLLSPGVFIPLFEKNGMITWLDEYVWEQSCRYLRRWMDAYPNEQIPTVSVNVSRIDIYDPHLCAKLQQIIQKYYLPASALHLEITESAYMENPHQLIDTVHELQQAGFNVEMDDFGSGYSSLNTLKDVAVDVLKMDMKFLATSGDGARVGNILSSIIRMAHWLKIPVIAEGVETKDQADYLKSLSCLYMQGYYFAKPMPAQQFETLLCQSRFDRPDRYGSVNLEGIVAFWDASAQTTLLFNSFVGGAAILEYENGNLSVIRANDRFYEELGATRENYLSRQQNSLDRFDAKNATMYISMLNEAIRTGDEAECDLQDLPLTEGCNAFWTHNRVRLLAKNGDIYLFYLSIENITARKRLEKEREAENERNRLLMKNTGISFFDYDCANGVFTYQTYLPNRGIKVFVIPRYQQYIEKSNIFSSESISSILNILSESTHEAVSGEFEYRANLWKKGMRWYRARYARVADGFGHVYRLVGQIDDIQAIKEREALAETIRKRLNARSYEQIFDEVIVNQIFNLFYQSSDVIGAIETTLSLLGEYYDLSRAYIFEDSEDHTTASNTFEWCAPDVSPQMDSLQNVPYTQMGGRDALLACFDQHDTYHCANVNDLGPEARALLEPQGIYSMLQFAIRDNGVFSGMIGFDECRRLRSWSDSELGTLAFVSRIIALFLLRLRQSDSAAFSGDFRAALDDNAAYVYIIDPKTYDIIYVNRSIRAHSTENYIGCKCYETFVGVDSPCAECPVRMLYETEGPHIAEISRSDGMLLLTQASKLRWNGRDMAMLSCIDITESKKFERALVTEQQKTDLALTAANLTLWTYDMENDSFLVTRSTNGVYHAGNVIQGSFHTVLSLGMVMPDSIAGYIALHENILNGLQTSSATIHFNAQIAPAEWMKITYIVLPSVSARPTVAIATAVDVTAQVLAETRYQQEAEYRKTLGQNCIFSLRINITDDVVEDVQATADNSSAISPGMQRNDIVPLLANSLTNESDRIRFSELLSAEHIRTLYARGETQFESSFRAQKSSGGLRYLCIDVRLAERPADGDLIAFVAVRDQTAEMLIRRMMEKLVDTGYDYIAYIDAHTKHFKLFASHANSCDILPNEGEDFDSSARNMLSAYACQSDVAHIIREVSIENVKKQLAKQPEYVCGYRSTSETGSRMRQLIFRALDTDLSQLMLTRQDVTALFEEERTNREQLEQALDQAREASAAKSEFLTRISHDIRMPLNAVIGLTTLALNESDLPENIAEYLRSIDSSGQFLLGLIRDILDVSIIEQRITQLHPQRYAFRTFKSALKATFVPLCEEKNITFQYDADATDLAIWVDPVRFNQIFFNVLTNAVQFTPEGGVVRYSEENIHMDDGILSCDYVIRDTGCGIGENFMPHVFEPFSREGRCANADVAGSGIGLTISKRIVDLMNGTIRITSVPDAGTTVRIHLDLPIDSTASAQKDRLCQQSSNRKLDGVHVLLAEDVPIDAVIVEKLLALQGAELTCVENGLLAVDRFASASPGAYDIILLDVFMPVMDGLEAAHRIRALPREDAACIPIVALSANAFPEDQALSKEAGMDAHLSKPLDQALLLETIARLIRRSV